MKYIKTFNNHETYEQNLQVDYPTLSHCQTEEHIHLTPKYFITYKAEEKMPSSYGLYIESFDAEVVDHIFNNGKGIIIFDKPLLTMGEDGPSFQNPSLAIELDMPSTLERIDSFFSASSNPDHVKRLIFRSVNPPSLSSNNMFDTYFDAVTYTTIRYPNLKIYVPHDSVDAYKTAENWSAYADIIFSISQLSQDQEEDEEED